MTHPRNPLVYWLLSLSLAIFMAGDVTAGDDPFGVPGPFEDDEPEVEVTPKPGGAEVEIEDADRVEVETGPDGVRIEVEEEVPSYETEEVVLTPRADWILEFPHTRVDLLQSRLNGYGFVDNRHEWASLWVLCNGRKPLPKVDFTRELVVYYLNTSTGSPLPAVAFVTDGNLSLREMYLHGPARTRGFFAPMHVQVVPRAGLIRLVDKTQSLLIPGGFLAEPANPAEPLKPVVPVVPVVPVDPEPVDPEPVDDLFGR